MKLYILFFILFSTIHIFAQDERYFRKVMTGEVSNKFIVDKQNKQYKLKANSSFYEVDLNGDGFSESIVTQKRDNEDWLHIHDFNKTRIKSFKFIAHGKDSWIYKVSLRRLSNRTNVLLVHFFEGSVEYTQYNATSRLYVINIDSGDLSTIKIHKGPVLFEEVQGRRGRYYYQRQYNLILNDYNRDGINEIIIKKGLISRGLAYLGNGKWRRL